MKGRCSRCGRQGHVEYGIDGKSYCSSCIFYGMTKQCWRCRMYLPAAELQQYKGQWVCPYCIMELRDEDRRMQKPPETYKKKPLSTTPLIYRETCERCGRAAEFFYIWNGRKLCKSCLEEEQAKWGMAGGGPSAAPTRVVYNRGGQGIIGSIISDIISRITGRRKSKRLEGEIVAAGSVKVEAEIKKKDDKKNVVSFRYGKPMSEGLGEEEKKEEKPESEGLMKSKEGKKKRKLRSEGLMKTKKKKKDGKKPKKKKK